VKVFLPGGGERTIHFAAGRATSSDGPGAVSVEKAADLNRVKVGEDERFEVPDAVIVGG